MCRRRGQCGRWLPTALPPPELRDPRPTRAVPAGRENARGVRPADPPGLLPAFARRWRRPRRSSRSLWVAERDGDVLPAEAEGVGEDDLHLGAPRSFADHVDGAVGIELAVMGGTRKDSALEGQQ